ncbi:MAG: site-specific integrase [Alphaproteobacteria bacterium]|nr:site-specific integrase [Alphaproteobacteria bacterium]MBP9777092.1 site-specific integrase [Alphaproteobacteria bacterium]
MRTEYAIKKTNKYKLTKRIVENVEPDESKRIVLWDAEITGFCVRIYPSGKKTYFFQYRNKDRKSHIIKIGVHGNITTKFAREKALKISLSISLGEDSSLNPPQEDNHTILNLAEEYLKHHVKIKKVQKGYREDKAVLNEVVLKKYGSVKVKSISTFDLQKLHSELEKTPYKANRVRALLSKMFSLAIQWGWRSDNPINGVEKYNEYERPRWLNDEELQRLWTILDAHYNQSEANAIRLLLLTGSRRDEVLQATWNQFDLEKEVWAKPAHTTKQKRMEHLSLSIQTIEILKNMKAQSDSSFLFPSKITGESLQGIKKAWNTIKTRANLADVHLRDLRYTRLSHLVSSGLT